MRTSLFMALFVAIAIGLWLYTGDVIVGGQADQKPSIAEQQEQATQGSDQAAGPVAVRVQTISAIERQSVLRLRGRTEAKDRVELRAETEGAVAELAVEKGDRVSKGDLVCRIDQRTRRASLAQAKALLAQSSADLEAAETLLDRGFTPQNRVRELRALRDAAAAAVEAGEWDLAQTDVVAPISGVIEDLPVRIGSLLQNGALCARIVDLDPMLAVMQVSENDVSQIEIGQPAKIRPVTGGEFVGQVTYIAPAADSDTRTFRVDVEVENADGRVRDSVTTAAEIPVADVSGHLIAPSMLILSDAGEIGVRSVDTENIVRFLPVAIVADTRDGIWVSGLPETVQIISVGQEYVTDGLVVDPVFETAQAEDTQ